MIKKSVVVFVFLASVVMIPRWSKAANNHYCPDAGIEANAALKNLLDNGKKINMGLNLGIGCGNDMKRNAKRTDQDPNVKFVYDEVCYAVGEEDNLFVWVLSKTKEVNPATEIQGATAKECANKNPYQSLYLPQEKNKNTYMILNPQMAVLFFTTKLSGCDVFIAKSNNLDQPLVVHSNKDDLFVYTSGKMLLEKNEAEHLKLKGEDVDRILQTTTDYKVWVRVYHKPSFKAAEKVIDDYKRNHNQAEMVEYNNEEIGQAFHFFGKFANNRWEFFLKGDQNGKIIWKKCLNQQSSCVTM